MKYKDLYKLPVVPHPNYKPVNRLKRRNLQLELIRLNRVFWEIEKKFLFDVFESEKSYRESFNDFVEAWEHCKRTHKAKYCLVNDNYTRKYTPVERFVS